MLSPRFGPLVTVAALLAATLPLGACATISSRSAPPASAAEAGQPSTIRFDNVDRERVHVYLVGQRREWLLGRVEPGARAVLRIPAEALAEGPAFMQIAVVPGSAPTLSAVRHARARLTVVQPTAALLAQRWSFSQGQLTSLELRGVSTGGRPR